MTTASVTTDFNFGPYKIPSNAQNMIMNNFAERNGLKVEVVIPEPIMSDQLGTTQWLNTEFKFKNIILCSIHQLPQKKIYFNRITKNLNKSKFHFAIEGLSGQGYDFLNDCKKEANFFNKMKIINSEKTNWIKLYNKLINDL